MTNLPDKPDQALRHGFYTGNRHDIALSPKQYYEITDILLDQFLSRRMMMNFKLASQVYYSDLQLLPLLSFPFSYFLARLPFQFYKRQSDVKMHIPLTIMTHCIVTYKLYHMGRPRNIYTRIIADPTFDGQYIRNQIQLSKPELWKQISRDLYKKGYNFPEMLEYQEATEFLQNFVDPL